MQMERYVVKVIHSDIVENKKRPRFNYVNKGQMATIGRSRTVDMFKGHEFMGFIDWAAWLVVHIYYLIGFKNRLFVLFQWACTYFTYRCGTRLIIDKN
jgi:NADH dehydrogenase